MLTRWGITFYSSLIWLRGKIRRLNAIRAGSVESGWDGSSQDASRGSISSYLHLRGFSTLWLHINLSGLCQWRKGGSGAGSLPDVAQPDSELVQTSTDKLQQSAGPGWSAPVWWTGTPEELGLFVCPHSNKTTRLSTVSADILATVNACMCVGRFSNNGECGELRRLQEHRACWVKCVPLCQWDYIALWSFLTHLTQYTQTLRLSQTVCQLSENTFRLSAVFFLFQSRSPPRKQECYFLSEICYRCNPPMLLSGNTNEHQFSFITFHFTQTHTHKIFSSTSRGYSTTQQEQTLCLQLILFVSPVWWSWVSLGHSQNIVGSHRA